MHGPSDEGEADQFQSDIRIARKLDCFEWLSDIKFTQKGFDLINLGVLKVNINTLHY